MNTSGSWNSMYSNSDINSKNVADCISLPSVESCSTISNGKQIISKPNNIVCTNTRINNQNLVKRVDNLENIVRELSETMKSITNVGNLNGECVSHINLPDSSSEQLNISDLTISPDSHSEIVGGKRSRRRRRKSVKRKRKQSKKNHRKTRR